MTYPLTRPLTRKLTYPLTAALGGDPAFGAVSVPLIPTPSDFPYIYDGNTPRVDAWLDQHKHYAQGVTYANDADFIAAGGALTGDFASQTKIAVALLGSPPYTIRIEAIVPASYNAGGRNYLFALYGADSSHYATMRLDQTTAHAQFLLQNSTTQISPVIESSDTPDGLLATFVFTIGTNIARFTSKGRVIQGDTTISLPTFTQGLAIGYTPFGAGGEWNGTIKRVTVWGAALSLSQLRALSVGNMFGPSGISAGATGGGAGLKITGYTYISEVSTSGDNIDFKIRDDNRQLVGIRTLASVPGTEDDHNRAPWLLTNTSAMVRCWTDHDNGAGFSFRRSANTDFENFNNSGFLTMAGKACAYGTLLNQVSTGNIFFLCRSNQCYWEIAKSTDDGVSWTALGRWLDNSIGNDKTLSYFYWLDADTVRCFFQEEPVAGNAVVKILDMNVTTGALVSGAGSVGTIGVGNGAVFGNCSTIWNPGVGFSAFAQQTASATAFQGGVLDEGANTQAYYWINCNNPSSPYLSASWTKTLIVQAGLGTGVSGKWKGGCCIIRVPGLATPQIISSRLDSGDNLFHVERYIAADAAGSAWAFDKLIGTGGDPTDQMYGRPCSVEGASSLVPFTLQRGRLQDFNDYGPLYLEWQLVPA